MIITIIIFIITLIFLMFVHEMGHFLMAKRFGIKVLEFGFGIPPKIFSRKIKGMDVSLNWIPIGAFVRLLGEDEVDKKILKNPESFAAQTPLKRLAVIVAGVAMNLILAWIIFYVVLYQQGFKVQLPLIVPHQFTGVEQSDQSLILVGSVSPDSPAEASGVKPGEAVVAINGSELTTSSQLVEETKKLSGEKVILTLKDPNSGISRTVEVTPRVNPPSGQGPLGVAFGEVKSTSLDFAKPWQKALSGPIHSLNLSVYSFKVLGLVIGKSFTEKDVAPVASSVYGPVGIAYVAGSILHQETPFLPYLNFIAIISLNLAVFNLLPIPALDGGRIPFILFEMVLGKKIKEEIEQLVHRVGFALLLTLALVITMMDIKKFF